MAQHRLSTSEATIGREERRIFVSNTRMVSGQHAPQPRKSIPSPSPSPNTARIRPRTRDNLRVPAKPDARSLPSSLLHASPTTRLHPRSLHSISFSRASLALHCTSNSPAGDTRIAQASSADATPRNGCFPHSTRHTRPRAKIMSLLGGSLPVYRGLFSYIPLFSFTIRPPSLLSSISSITLTHLPSNIAAPPSPHRLPARCRALSCNPVYVSSFRTPLPSLRWSVTGRVAVAFPLPSPLFPLYWTCT